MLCQFRHLPSELVYGNSPPPVFHGSDTVKNHNMPVVGSNPAVYIFGTKFTNGVTADSLRAVLADVTAVYLEEIHGALHGIINLMSAPTCLLVSSADYGVLDGLCDVTKRITV